MRHSQPHSSVDFEVLESGEDSEYVVVLIHGSMDRSAGMARISRLTSTVNRCIRYDRRGYGQRWDHPGPLDVSGHVDDVENLLQGRRAVVVGHSYGGQVALGCASRLGSQIVGVSTYETPLSWMPWWPLNSAGQSGIDAGPEMAAEVFMIKMIGESRWNGLPEKTRQQRQREGRALVAELSALRHGPSWMPDEISCPVICGVGSLAPHHHVQAVQWLSAQLSQVKVVVIDGAQHGAHISHPGPFVDELIRPHLAISGTVTEMS